MAAVVRPFSATHIDGPINRTSTVFSSTEVAASPKAHSDGRSAHGESLAPPSPYPQHLHPSPTESTGTDGTEIDEEAQDETPQPAMQTSEEDAAQGTGANAPSIISPTSPSTLAKLDTNIKQPGETTLDDAPTSVIHAPHGFKELDSNRPGPASLASPKPKALVASPSTPDAAKGPDDKRLSGQGISQSNDSTDTVSTAKPALSSPGTQSSKRASFASSVGMASVVMSDTSKQESLDIQVVDVDGDLTYRDASDDHAEVSEQLRELQDTMTDMWTLCNRLAGLSAEHRSRAFAIYENGDLQETAWKSCWRLCQELYRNRDQPLSNINQALELCREFTQARFEARPKADAKTDAILRVSFEMCNHLYNIRDRTLPPAFVKRTMDFYVTFCHRMMQQKSAFPRETDELIGACWTLAETLYHLQYPVNDERSSEEDLVSAVVQSCWDLSDLFRSGWSQGKTAAERSTPRPVQATFSSRSQGVRATASEGRRSAFSDRTFHAGPSFPQHQPPLPPETPITIFDDITEPSSPESTNAPNILVLGPDAASVSRQQRPSRYLQRSSSGTSGFSEASDAAHSSQRTSSTTTRNETGNHHLRMLRVLLLKAALDAGYSPPSTTPFHSSSEDESVSNDHDSSRRLTGGTSLQAYVKALPRDTFGPEAAQLRLFDHYKDLVANDPSLRDIRVLLGGRYAASDIAKAVAWLADSDLAQWGWMRDLYGRVMGSGIERMGKSQAELEL